MSKIVKFEDVFKSFLAVGRDGNKPGSSEKSRAMVLSVIFDAESKKYFLVKNRLSKRTEVI
jgi:hypothetical protein